jgi:hypothetical protein
MALSRSAACRPICSALRSGCDAVRVSPNALGLSRTPFRARVPQFNRPLSGRGYIGPICVTTSAPR